VNHHDAAHAPSGSSYPIDNQKRLVATVGNAILGPENMDGWAVFICKLLS